MTSKKPTFFKELESLIPDQLYLTYKTDELDQEIKHNHWQISLSKDIVCQSASVDFLDFLQKVNEDYKKRLDN